MGFLEVLNGTGQWGRGGDRARQGVTNGDFTKVTRQELGMREEREWGL